MRRLGVMALLLALGLSIIIPTLSAEQLPERVLSPSAPVSFSTPLPADLPPPSLDGEAPTALDLVGGNFPIADFLDTVTGADNLDLPGVAYNSRRGHYLVVWHGAMRATGYNIYAREVSAGGGVSPTIVAVCEAPRDQEHPSIAYDAQADQYWAAWEDERSGAGSQIYARRLSSLGTPSGAEIMVNTSTNVATDARLACGGGRCVIVWAEAYSETLEVYARAYDGAGNALTSPVRVSAADSKASKPDVAYNGTTDQYLVVWSEQHPGTGLDIKGQVLNSSLSPIGAVVSICAAAGDQDQARVAYNLRSNRYCAVWRDRRSGTSWDIYGQILTSTGQLRGASLSLYAGRDGDGEPAITARDNEEQFLVSFGADQPSSMRQYYPCIRACTVTGAGAVSSAFDVRPMGVNRCWSPAVVHHAGSDEYLVVWMDGYFWPGDIMAQRVRGNRVLVGSAFMACATRKGQEEPAVAYNSQRNEYLVA